MFKTEREQSILDSNKRKEMLSLYRNIVTKMSGVNLKNLNVDVVVSFSDDFGFHITVFDKVDCSNGTFTAYGFQDISAIKNDSILVMAAIKSDSFSEFDRVLKEIFNKNYPSSYV